MSRSDAPVDAGDARWVARVGEVFRPAPLDDAGRTRFDARLRERIEARAARRRLVPAAVTAAALAPLLAFALWPAPRGTDPVQGARAGAVSAWEEELFLASDEAREDDVEAGLPDDYVAIAYAFSTP
jgi:hypothetical protein